MNNPYTSPFSPETRSFPEANKWELSQFVVNHLVKIVGVTPFPLDELLFICSSLSFFRPDIIIEWGTHTGVSARVFYETVNHLGIKAEVHSIDLPPESDHVENVKALHQRGMFVRGLPVTLHLGDGLETARTLLRGRKYAFPLFLLDGDHSFDSVWRELNGVKDMTGNAAILVHDAFYQGKESNYNCGPYEAVRKFTGENGLPFWSTSLGLPGMCLVWLGGPQSKKSVAPLSHPKEEESQISLLEDTLTKQRGSTENQELSILHTVEFYYPHVGGAETVVQKISETLAKRGHFVEVATTVLQERTQHELNGVRIHEFEVAGNLSYGLRGRDVRRYQDFLAAHRADVMMNYAAQQWATDVAFFTIDATRGKRVNIVAPCGYSALQDARTLRWPQFAEYFGRVIPHAIPSYDAAVYHSSLYKDYEFAQLHGFQNSVVIPNGVDEEEFAGPPAIDFRHKYKITTPFIGLCVANYYREKGQDTIVEAVKKMNRQDFTMVFIGKDGEFIHELKRMADGPNMIFLVNIPREDTVAAYHAADIFLFGSVIEASPLVIIEAKASKTPFVSTDCGNVREWKGGLVCGPADIASEANRILDDASLRNQLAEEGYREWKEKLTWTAVVDRYEELYLRLHRSKKSHASVPLSGSHPDLQDSPIPPAPPFEGSSEEVVLLESVHTNPRDLYALTRLAEIEINRKNLKKARNYIIAAQALDPKNEKVKALTHWLSK